MAEQTLDELFREYIAALEREKAVLDRLVAVYFRDDYISRLAEWVEAHQAVNKAKYDWYEACVDDSPTYNLSLVLPKRPESQE